MSFRCENIKSHNSMLPGSKELYSDGYLPQKTFGFCENPKKYFP